MKKLLEVNNLSISFHTYGGEVQAVRDVNFELHEGETLAIVGESGSGKSVTVQSIMRLLSMPPGEFKSGSIIILPTASEKSINSDCKDVANKNDFLRIRKRMAAEKDNDAMVLAAKKVFKTKCFSTEQIRNLSYLFLSDEGRYMFFDAAYPYTSDMEKFPTLISQLKDEYYINRFEAMIQK